MTDEPKTPPRIEWLEKAADGIYEGMPSKADKEMTRREQTNLMIYGFVAAILPVWLLAFGLKIYFDFSAYSDIAIGFLRRCERRSETDKCGKDEDNAERTVVHCGISYARTLYARTSGRAISAAVYAVAQSRIRCLWPNLKYGDYAMPTNV